MSVPFSSRLKVLPDVRFRMVGEEGVVLQLGTERYLGMDAIGVRMWTLLTASRSIQDAYDALIQEFEVEADRLRVDLAEFIDELIAQQLVEVEATAARPTADP